MNIERLEKICNINSVSSNEVYLKEYFKSLFKDGVFIEDNLGSIFYHLKSKKPNAKKVLISCSGDEVGLIINNKNGNLYSFLCLEPISPLNLIHKEVEILKRDDTFAKGIIVTNKYKLNENYKNNIEINDLAILTFDENVSIGDLASYQNNFKLNNNHIISKALNQKAMFEVIISLIEKLKHIDLDYDLFLGFVGMSTIGQRGSQTSAFVIEPDLSLVLTGFEISNSNLNFNDGVVVGYYDRLMLPNRKLLEDFKNKITAKEYFGLKVNDGSFIHKTLKGCPSLSVGIGIYGIDSGVEVLSVDDLKKLSDSLYDYLIDLEVKNEY